MISNSLSTKLPSVVVIGGSFGGYTAAKKLAAKKIANIHVIEKYKYHAHSFAFPRYSVFAKHKDEAKLFVPIYESQSEFPINTIFNTATNVTENKVELADGTSVPYDYLVIATGVDRSYPAGYGDVTPTQGSDKMSWTQKGIEAAKNIAIVGAGAFGVQLATDIKWVYGSAKNVTLYNSRSHILPRFPDHVWQIAEPFIEKLGVKLSNESRPDIINDKELRLTDKKNVTKTVEYDLILNCTGRGSTLNPFRNFLSNNALSPGDLIYTESTLQVKDHPNVFAVGDVVYGAPHMAKSARAQGTIAAENIARLIEKSEELVPYKATDRENSIKLTLGYENTLIGRPKSADLLSHEPKYQYSVQKIQQLYDIPTAASQL